MEHLKKRRRRKILDFNYLVWSICWTNHVLKSQNMAMHSPVTVRESTFLISAILVHFFIFKKNLVHFNFKDKVWHELLTDSN